jgi:signal transduction histidine kinase
VEDDGIGFTSKKVAGSNPLGILGMKERARYIGGKVTIKSVPKKGTKLEMQIPIGDNQFL